METLNSIIKVLGLNHTFFIYVVAFAVLVFILSKWLIAPYYRKFLERESQTKGQTLRAETVQKENQQLQQEYEQLLIKYDRQFQTALQEAKSQMLIQQQEEIEKAQRQATQSITESRNSLEATFLKIQQQLKKEAPLLAQNLTLKLTE